MLKYWLSVPVAIPPVAVTSSQREVAVCKGRGACQNVCLYDGFPGCTQPTVQLPFWDVCPPRWNLPV